MKITLLLISIVAGLFLSVYFLDKRDELKRIELLEKILTDFNPKEAYFNKPTLLNLSCNCSDFIDVSTDCAILSVCYEVASHVDYVCRGSDGEVEVFISGHRLLLARRKNVESPRESFDFLLNIANAVPPEMSDVMKKSKNAFAELVALLAAKAFMCHETEEIFHVKMDPLEMVLERSGKFENFWGATVYYVGNYYTAILLPKNEPIQPHEVARLIASFRIKEWRVATGDVP